MSVLFPVKHQQPGMTLAAFALMTGIPIQRLRRYARTGRLVGARQNPLSKEWWIYPPAQIRMGGLL